MWATRAAWPRPRRAPSPTTCCPSTGSSCRANTPSTPTVRSSRRRSCASRGTDYTADIDLADEIFREQGGAGTSFVSGARDTDGGGATSPVSTVDVNDYDELPEARRTARATVLEQARQRYFQDDSRRMAPELDRYDEFRRTVLIFETPESLFLGDANKRALRSLARDVDDGDVVVITACQDVDGQGRARARPRHPGRREELASLGLPASSAWLAPCLRSSFRHPSDDSPVPVEVVHMRPRPGPSFQ